MEYKQIQELIKAINKSNISELTVEEGEFKITIKQQQMSETQFVAVQSHMPMHQPMMQQPMQQQQQIQSPQQQSSGGQAAAAPSAQGGGDKGTTIKSPMIGTFYRSSAPDKPSFVNVGDEVKPGQVLCIIEAMKLFNEIESEVSGRIVKVLIDDASPVEYDQPLFLVEPI
jgi:acetyl-CoA carboxylase biotin carboxyl carrier protein